MNRPTPLKWIRGIAWLQVAQAVLLVATFSACIAAPAAEGFWLGFQNSFVRGMSSAQSVREFGAE